MHWPSCQALLGHNYPISRVAFVLCSRVPPLGWTASLSRSRPDSIAQYVVHSVCELGPLTLNRATTSWSRRRDTATLGFLLSDAPDVLAHGLGQGWKRLSKWLCLGELFVRGFRRVWVAGNHALDLIFGQVPSRYTKLLSLKLAGRMEITETLLVPRWRTPRRSCRPPSSL